MLRLTRGPGVRVEPRLPAAGQTPLRGHHNRRQGSAEFDDLIPVRRLVTRCLRGPSVTAIITPIASRATRTATGSGSSILNPIGSPPVGAEPPPNCVDALLEVGNRTEQVVHPRGNGRRRCSVFFLGHDDAEGSEWSDRGAPGTRVVSCRANRSTARQSVKSTQVDRSVGPPVNHMINRMIWRSRKP